jgi:hypothetical protein
MSGQPPRAAIATPEHWYGVHSEAECVAHAKGFLVRLGVPPAAVRESGRMPHAYVSGGAWLVRCACQEGAVVSAHPGDGTAAWPRPVAVCLACGAILRPVFPADRAAAEAALLERPDPANRHFFPHEDQAAWVGERRGQTVADLKRENRARGLGSEA